MFRFFQRLENFERNYPIIFWLCTFLLGFFLFNEPFQISSQSQVVIKQLRGEALESGSSSFVTPINLHRSGQGLSQGQGFLSLKLRLTWIVTVMGGSS
jgi:hypothetical protein